MTDAKRKWKRIVEGEKAKAIQEMGIEKFNECFGNKIVPTDFSPEMHVLALWFATQKPDDPTHIDFPCYDRYFDESPSPEVLAKFPFRYDVRASADGPITVEPYVTMGYYCTILSQTRLDLLETNNLPISAWSLI